MATSKKEITNPSVQGQHRVQGRAPQLLTVEEVALRLAVSTKSIYRWIKDGQLPAVQLGRAVRVEEPAVAGFIDSRRIGAENYMAQSRFEARRRARSEARRRA